MANIDRIVEDEIIYVDTREELDAMLFRSIGRTVALRGTDPAFVRNFVKTTLEEIERYDTED